MRVAIVTGASSGIGVGIVQALARDGYAVAAVGRNAQRLQHVVDEVESLGKTVVPFTADLQKPAESRRVVEAVRQRFQRIDVLVLNAGVYPSATVEEITTDHFDEIFHTNVYAQVHMIQAAKNDLYNSSAGRIVMTSSITGPLVGMAGHAIYGASKAAQLGLMRNLAVELAEGGVTVNSVLPGKIEVERTASQSPEYIQAALDDIPLGRLGQPHDIGAAVTFFASEAASFITGQALSVDGGQVLPEVRHR